MPTPIDPDLIHARPDSSRCRGCRDDYYNGRNALGVERCWHLDKAEVVTRWKTGITTLPTTPGAFTEVRTFQCHRPRGFAYLAALPECAVAPIRLVRRSK